MSFTGYIRLGDCETHLKHPKTLYLRTSSTNFHLLKGTSLEKKKNACAWGEKAVAARQVLKRKKKNAEINFKAMKLARTPSFSAGRLNATPARGRSTSLPSPCSTGSLLLLLSLHILATILGGCTRAELHPLSARPPAWPLCPRGGDLAASHCVPAAARGQGRTALS